MDTLLTHPQNYKPVSRRPEQIRYLVIHYTGNKGDTAKNNADYYSRTVLQTSAHYFVDETQTWCSVPEEQIAWHCGRRDGEYRHIECRNANSIGIEICMLDKDGRLRQGSIDRAAALARSLMERYGIPVGQVVRHYDVTGKCCPAPMVKDPALWAAFLAVLAPPAAPGPSPEMDFASKMEQWRSIHDPIYEALEDIPAPLRPEAEELERVGALRGSGAGLHISLNTLRAAVIAKRYLDARIKEVV